MGRVQETSLAARAPMHQPVRANSGWLRTEFLRHKSGGNLQWSCEIQYGTGFRGRQTKNRKAALRHDEISGVCGNCFSEPAIPEFRGPWQGRVQADGIAKYKKGEGKNWPVVSVSMPPPHLALAFAFQQFA